MKSPGTKAGTLLNALPQRLLFLFLVAMVLSLIRHRGGRLP